MLNNQTPTHSLAADRDGHEATGLSKRPPLWFVLRVLRSRLHPARDGLCSCGACAHQVAVAARATGWAPESLWAALGQPADGTTPQPAGRPRRSLHTQVGSAATVVVSGRRVPAGVGLLHLAAAAQPRDS